MSEKRKLLVESLINGETKMIEIDGPIVFSHDAQENEREETGEEK